MKDHAYAHRQTSYPHVQVNNVLISICSVKHAPFNGIYPKSASVTHFTLHCYRIRIALTRERFVALGLPSWTHLQTRHWCVFTLQGTRRFAPRAWPM